MAAVMTFMVRRRTRAVTTRTTASATRAPARAASRTWPSTEGDTASFNKTSRRRRNPLKPCRGSGSLLSRNFKLTYFGPEGGVRRDGAPVRMRHNRDRIDPERAGPKEAAATAIAQVVHHPRSREQGISPRRFDDEIVQYCSKASSADALLPWYYTFYATTSGEDGATNRRVCKGLLVIHNACDGYP